MSNDDKTMHFLDEIKDPFSKNAFPWMEKRCDHNNVPCFLVIVAKHSSQQSGFVHIINDSKELFPTTRYGYSILLKYYAKILVEPFCALYIWVTVVGHNACASTIYIDHDIAHF